MDHIASGNAALVEEDFDGAIREYTAALAAACDDGERCVAQCRLSQACLAAGSTDDALEWAQKAVQSNSTHSDAHIRLGIALYNAARYREAQQALQRAAAIATESGKAIARPLETWLRRVEPKAAEEAKVAEAAAAAAAAEAAAAVRPPVRDAWFQSPTHVSLDLFVKGVTADRADIVFSTDTVTITIRYPDAGDDEEPFRRTVNLAGPIVPKESTVTFNRTKVSIRVAKAPGTGQWPALERAGSTAATTAAPVAANADGAAATPSSLPPAYASRKNWDAIAAAVDADEEDKPQGEEALNEMFKSIYSDGTDEQRRAMVKSYVESGGTVLSTDWNKVAKGEVKAAPPKGMEARRFDPLTGETLAEVAKEGEGYGDGHDDDDDDA